MKIPLLYKDRRSEGGTVLRQCQLVQLHLLHVVDAICKEHGIPYFLVGGTLLGAMRHDGFIPWDDDLDIGLLEKDYKRLMKVLPTALPEDVLLQSPETCPFAALPFSKLRDAYSFYYESRPDLAASDPCGIYIDVFPFEEFPGHGAKWQRFLVMACGSTWMRSVYFHNQARKGFLRAMFFAGLGCAFTLLHVVVRCLICLLKLILPCDTVFIKAECGYAHPYAKADMFPLTTHKFEDGDFPVPIHADRALTAQYGDWQQIPPPEKRPRHARIIDPFHSALLPGMMEYPNFDKIEGHE